MADIFASLPFPRTMVEVRQAFASIQTWVPRLRNMPQSYIEGRWFPGLTFGAAITTATGSSVGVAFAVQEGTYVAIGKLVYVSGRIALTSKGSVTGVAAITDLPFPVRTDQHSFASGPCYYANVSGSTAGLFCVAQPMTKCILLGTPTVTTVTTATNADFTNTSDLIFSFTYQVG